MLVLEAAEGVARIVVAGTVRTMVEPETVTTCGASVVTAISAVLAVVDGVVVVDGVGVGVVVATDEEPDSTKGVDEDVELPSREPTEADNPSSQMVHVLLPPPRSLISNRVSWDMQVLWCLQNSPGYPLQVILH